MILVADSGSTKTDWRLIDGSTISSFKTIGFNPYHIGSEQIAVHLQNSPLKSFVGKVASIYFYGAGCSSKIQKDTVKHALVNFFKTEWVEVEHDLLGAARAACERKEGMVAILGTGSNSCIYDGKKIVENIPALGYILGDEGGGAHMGKLFIKAYLENKLSKEITNKFQKEYQLGLTDILEAVYKKALPNRFLAQFSFFIYQNMDKEEISAIATRSFQSFFRHQICGYKDYKRYKLNLVGSLGFFYQNLIKEIAFKEEVKVGKIIKSPIDGLVEYHN